MAQFPFRFVDMIIALRNCLAGEQPYLPVFFNPKVNLLQESEYKKDKLQCVMHYLRRIANKGQIYFGRKCTVMYGLLWSIRCKTWDD